MIWLEFTIMVALIMAGANMKGIGLGAMGMVGMMVFVLVLGMRPADPPIDVMLIIMSIVTTAATLQAAGGLDYLVTIAEKIIRRHPSRITFVAPFTTYFLCLFAGTAHIVYSLLPIISEVAMRRRIRPERPLSISVIASHLAITASPMSAATAALVAILASQPSPVDISIVDVMRIGIPAGLIGIAVGALSVYRKGLPLERDPVFMNKMKDPDFAAALNTALLPEYRPVSRGAKTSVALFGLAILLIVLAGAFPQWMPKFAPGAGNYMVKPDGSLTMVAIISMVTLSISSAILLMTRTPAAEVGKSSLFNAMGVAVVSVFGVVWMASTFIQHNQAAIQHALGHITEKAPWAFTFAIILMAALMFSQAATTKAMIPLGMALGIPHPALLAMFPAVNADFILPGYPTLLAAIQFDRTGSTRIGRWVFNHSFMLPGLATIGTAIVTGWILAGWLLRG